MNTPQTYFGYDEVDVSWTFLTHRLKQRTVTFDDEVNACGALAITCINATKRLFGHSRPLTIESAIRALRFVIASISCISGANPSLSDCDVAVQRALTQAKLAEGTRHNTYKMCAAILREAGRVQNISLTTRNPFRRGNNPTPTAPRDDLKALLQKARQDAVAHLRDLTDSSSWHFPELVTAARDLAMRNGGCLPGSLRSPRTPLEHEWKTLLNRAKYRTKGIYTQRRLTRLCYPVWDTLFPYVVLLIYKLAANVDSVALMERDCMTEVENPVLGKRFLISIPKARSPGMQPYSVSDYGELSVPWLIRAVLSITEPLIEAASPEQRKYLFLAYSQKGYILPLITLRPSRAFDRYRTATGLSSNLTLKMLRPTRLVDEFAKSLDPFRVKRIAQHKHLSETMHYLDHPESLANEQALVADAQTSMLQPKNTWASKAIPESADAIDLISHLCTDPSHARQGVDEHGLCSNALWPLNDRHFVMRLEPRPVAFLLRRYEALCEAQARIPADRFSKLYFEERKLIETRYLPLIDRHLLASAQEILKTLSPISRLD